MRIKATCSKCRRDLLLSQLVEGPEITSRCLWCGTLPAPQQPLLPVTAGKGELVGMVSMRDLLAVEAWM